MINCGDQMQLNEFHSNIDYEMVQRSAKAVFDTKNVMKSLADRDNIEVFVNSGGTMKKYALIGYGGISPNHISAAQNNHLDFVGICDIDKKQ